MSKQGTNAQGPMPDEPVRTGWVLHQGGELGWTLREVEMFDSDVEKHTVRRWPAEIMSVVLAIMERRILRKLVERMEDNG